MSAQHIMNLSNYKATQMSYDILRTRPSREMVASVPANFATVTDCADEDEMEDTLHLEELSAKFMQVIRSQMCCRGPE